MNTATKPEAKPEAKRRTLAKVGETVHFFDDTRMQQYAQPGVGPYAAIVTLNDVNGACLQVFGPRGGNFTAEGVLHKSDLDPASKGRQRWWNRIEETPRK